MRNNPELQRYLNDLPISHNITFTHSPPYTQALNPVECAARQLYHLMNFYLQCGNLSVLSLVDMLQAAAYSMNQPLIPSRVTGLGGCSLPRRS